MVLVLVLLLLSNDFDGMDYFVVECYILLEERVLEFRGLIVVRGVGVGSCDDVNNDE